MSGGTDPRHAPTLQAQRERVLVCGSRDWFRYDLVEAELGRLPYGSTIIHGDAPTGADRHADRVARAMGAHVEPYPASWKRLGRAAGPIRNQRMLDEGKPTRALAFADDVMLMDGKWWPTTPGTLDMVMRLRRSGIPAVIVDLNGARYE